MKKNTTLTLGFKILVTCILIGFSSLYSLGNRALTSQELHGKQLFEGSKTLENGGPSCISCHNVKTKNMISGGLMAKDLTDVYSRLGEGISGWLIAPPFPSMEIAFQNNPLTEVERNDLQAFFKYVQEENETQEVKAAFDYMLFGGLGGFVLIIILFNLIWSNRKKRMTKDTIFNRQIKAVDAKF